MRFLPFATLLLTAASAWPQEPIPREPAPLCQALSHETAFSGRRWTVRAVVFLEQHGFVAVAYPRCDGATSGEIGLELREEDLQSFARSYGEAGGFAKSLGVIADLSGRFMISQPDHQRRFSVISVSYPHDAPCRLFRLEPHGANCYTPASASGSRQGRIGFRPQKHLGSLSDRGIEPEQPC